MHSPMFTLEVFPPKRNAPVGTIYDTLDGLEGLNPDFISVTYGHGTHSDRGAQYISDLYRRAITRYGIRQSMNRVGGRCHDNARCESMWASEFYLSTDIDNITK